MTNEIERICQSISPQERVTSRKIWERMMTILILNCLAIAAILAAHYAPN